MDELLAETIENPFNLNDEDMTIIREKGLILSGPQTSTLALLKKCIIAENYSIKWYELDTLNLTHGPLFWENLSHKVNYECNTRCYSKSTQRTIISTLRFIISAICPELKMISKTYLSHTR